MYVCQPGVAQRIKDVLPFVKIIMMLRNPVDRAYSEFHFTYVFTAASNLAAYSRRVDGA